MHIIKNPFQGSESLMQDIIAELGRKKLPNIGVFESKLLTRGTDTKWPITSLAILPESIHGVVEIAEDWKVTVKMYKHTAGKPTLDEIARQEIDAKTLVAGALKEWCAAFISMHFFYERYAFDDAEFVLQWDNEIWPQFKGSHLSALSFLTQESAAAQPEV